MSNDISIYFYKNNSEDSIWLVEKYYYDCDGTYINNPKEKLFSFDRNKIYDYNKDYPHNLTEEELELFNKNFSNNINFNINEIEKKFINFHKLNKKDKVFRVDNFTVEDGKYYKLSLGKILFSFDKKNIYNYWTDYPNNLAKEEIELVDKYISPF